MDEVGEGANVEVTGSRVRPASPGDDARDGSGGREGRSDTGSREGVDAAAGVTRYPPVITDVSAGARRERGRHKHCPGCIGHDRRHGAGAILRLGASIVLGYVIQKYSLGNPFAVGEYYILTCGSVLALYLVWDGSRRVGR